MVWLSLEAVLEMHTELIHDFGGSIGIRDLGLLESALARPRNRYAYDDEADATALAAAYAFGIARNHPFLDGNKRTALMPAIRS